MDQHVVHSHCENLRKDTLGLGESIVETTRGPMLVLDDQLRIKVANRSFCRTFHVSKEETEGQYLFEFGNDQWDLPELRRLLKEVLREKSSVNDFEIEHDFTSLGRRSMLLDVRRVGRAEDRSELILLAIEDVTEQRLVEQLQAAHRRKDEFLAMLAHELRNPLAPIRSGLDVLAMGEREPSKTIEMMQAQVAHVVRLVDDLLDISRIMRERIDLRRKPVDLSSLVEQSVEAVRPLVQRHQQELSISLPEEPIYVNADSVRIVQVIENLLNNASKYTGVGGRIELLAEQRGAVASITVRDTGVGIDVELLPNVFELFTQSQRSLDRAEGGLGIGLTLVKRLLELHEGTISAASEGPGRGSTFIAELPAIKAVEQTETGSESFATTERRRIVVVDDHEGAAWMLCTLLKKLGDHEIETAHDGLAALQVIKETHPEIVLLDIGLPGMDGYEVARAVRAMPGFEDVLLIALTGYGQEQDRRKSKEGGFDEHLIKPPSVDQMRAVLAHPRLHNARL